jgi:heme/copper-type cytochrome/quinol oxidase subunit 4
MDVAEVLIAIVGLVASVTTYCLMRFPHMRREPFRRYAACSVLVSSLAALAVLCLSLLVLIAQYAWQEQ